MQITQGQIKAVFTEAINSPQDTKTVSVTFEGDKIREELNVFFRSLELDERTIDNLFHAQAPVEENDTTITYNFSRVQIDTISMAIKHVAESQIRRVETVQLPSSGNQRLS